jgi:hypothetical protein
MANPTSNFNWQMPTASDLVTDLPADFEVFGQAVDTSLADLKGGTTDQVLAKNSNTDMDFKWVTSDDANAIQNSIVDAKGDLIAASANDTPARLAVGTNGQVLTADSTAATGMKWALDGNAGPSFGVKLSGVQTVTANTWTKVTFNSEDWDTDSCFDSSTNYRFTPTVAGYYQFNLNLMSSGSTQGAFYKNGSNGRLIVNNVLNAPAAGSTIFYLNGSSDYVEAYVNSTGTTIYNSANEVYFSGSMIRKA